MSLYKSSILVLSLIAINGTTRAASTTAVPFLEMGTGARALGMGEAYSAIASGADALFWNPAGMANDNSVEVLLNHQPLMDLLKYDVGGVVMPVGNSRFGIGYTQLQSDSIDSLDSNGNVTGSFNAKDQLFVGGYAHAAGRFQWGLSAKYIKSSLANESANAYAADAGINVVNPWSSRLSHAFLVQNVGSGIKYDQETDSLPRVFKFGNAFRVNDRINLGLDFASPKSGSFQTAIGGELAIPIKEQMGLSLRAGYGTKNKDLGGVAGLGLGAGVMISALRIDFAWVPENDFGSSEVFTLTYRFSGAKQPTVQAAAPASIQTASAASATPTAGVLSVDVAKGFASSTSATTKAAKPTQNAVPQARQTVHEVQAGETLGSISRRFYGDHNHWKKIYEANKNVIADPDSLDVGTKLVIPKG